MYTLVHWTQVSGSLIKSNKTFHSIRFMKQKYKTFSYTIKMFIINNNNINNNKDNNNSNTTYSIYCKT